MKLHSIHKAGKVYPYLITTILLFLFLTLNLCSNAQEKTAATIKDTVATKDLIDVIKKVLKKKEDSSQVKKKKSIAILPTLGYNPSVGFQIGGKVSAQRILGDPATTNASVVGLIAAITTKGIINLQAIHNVFTPNDKMNWQGNWQLTFTEITDYGIGPGLEYPDSADIIKFSYLRLFEKAYFKVAPNLYIGGGLNINLRKKIEDENQSSTYNTAHQTYSVDNDFDTLKYSANGILAVFQYNNRENPIRSYGGIYADLSVQFNQKWLGSTKTAVQVVYDFRKYISLSKRNPATVLAFWQRSSFKLGGTLPYLELPNTSDDSYTRSGRGYTFGRFKGPSYFYIESEYRFPISRNKLFSGVCFINSQSTSNSVNKELFNSWAWAGGAGLRVLFQKDSRTTICFDYAIGEYGSKGFFIGLNEVF